MTAKHPPIVALIGRTNAGKSTLFNRLTETNQAIVSPAENTTRDQNHGQVYWQGGMCELIDTGGVDTTASDALDQEIQKQIQYGLKQADLILYVVDGRGEVLPQDRLVSQLLRKTHKPVVVALNKADNQKWRQHALATFSGLGFKHAVLCSALNGSGTGDLLDDMFKLLPHYDAPASLADVKQISLALVGRPNVGKSSLFNALIGEDKVIVSDLPHTTRDINDSFLEYKNERFRVIDTAGIRRKNRVGDASDRQLGKIESYSVRESLAMIAQSDVTVLMVEAQRRVPKQDKALVHYAKTHGKGLVIVVNKWDLIPDKDPVTINKYITYFRTHLEIDDYIPLLFISAKEKQRVRTILDEVMTVQHYRSYYAPQTELDQALYEVMSLRPKRRTITGHDISKKPLDLIALRQSDINPPYFYVICPHPKEIAPALYRLIEKKIREHCPYTGVAINLTVRNS